MKEAARIKIDVQIGRNAKSRFGAVDAASQDIVDKIMDTAVGRIRTRAVVRLQGLEKHLQRQVAAAYMEAMEFANQKMVGLESESVPRTIKFPQPHIFRPAVGVNYTGASAQTQWAPLSKRTLLAKRVYLKSTGVKSYDTAERRARRYFVHTGRLKNELVRGARKLVRNTGLVKLYHRARGTPRVTAKMKEIPLADLRIHIMPSIPARSLTAKDGSFERAMGISPESVTKLVGTKHHRAMLAPVFSYWTTYHIPNVVAQAMAQVISERRLDTRNAVGNMAEGGF